MVVIQAEFQKLREDLTSMREEAEVKREKREEAAEREATANRESEAKLERSRKERSLGTSFAGQGDKVVVMQLVVEKLLFRLWAPCGHVG